MRVALVCTEKLPVPPVRGGAIQIYIAGVAPLLAGRFDVTVYGIADPDLPPDEFHPSLPLRFRRFPREGYEAAVAAELAAERFDVVEVFNRPKNLLRFAAAAPGTRYVLSLHNEMFRDDKISQADGQRCVDLSATIVTVSRYLAQTVTARFPSALPKLHPVYSGVNLALYPPRGSAEAQRLRAAARSACGLNGEPVVLYVGRLSEVKGVHLLIETMPAVLARHPDARLLIVGSKWFGSNEIDKYVRRLFKLAQPFGGRVIFTQFVPVDAVPALYQAGDVFVCSSQWQEPLARVHYEAMAASLPVITTRRGGNAEVVEDGRNAIVLDNFAEPTAFARAIDALLAEPERAAAMGRRGREIAEERFGWPRVADDLAQILAAAVGPGL